MGEEGKGEEGRGGEDRGHGIGKRRERGERRVGSGGCLLQLALALHECLKPHIAPTAPVSHSWPQRSAGPAHADQAGNRKVGYHVSQVL